MSVRTEILIGVIPDMITEEINVEKISRSRRAIAEPLGTIGSLEDLPEMDPLTIELT